ncbi:MAG: hypothetical protein ACK2T6_04265 [Anaerolineae bacterium]|jgi:hypothetical protein
MARQRSYILRCMPVRGASGDSPSWRFSIQEAAPRSRRRAFTSIEALLDHVCEDLAAGERPERDDRAKPPIGTIDGQELAGAGGEE